MHKQILIYSIAAVYFLLATYGLFIFQAGPLVTVLMLFGLPSYFLAKYSAMPLASILSVSAFGVGIGVLLEGSAQIYGLWEISSQNILIAFGSISIEMMIVAGMQTLFVVLLYEFLSDDMEYSLSNARNRFASFGIFALGCLALVAVHYFFFKSFASEGAYYWIVSILIVSSIAALSLNKRLTIRLFDKLVNFSIIAAIPLLLMTLLGVWNEHIVFSQSFSSATLFGFDTTIPLGQLLLVFTLPFFIATIYELYLDDRE